jgi:hypothetical protein
VKLNYGIVCSNSPAGGSLVLGKVNSGIFQRCVSSFQIASALIFSMFLKFRILKL